MGMIYIQDTGYIKPTNEGTQATTRANSGNAISLKTAEFTPALKRNINNNAEVGLSTPSEVNLGSLENMKFTLRCVLNTTNSTDMDKVQHLLQLLVTAGYKAMWYDYTDATNEKNNGQLIYQLALNSNFGRVFTAAEMSAFTISTAFSHLNVHFIDIQPRQVGTTNLITYTLTGIVLPVEADTL